MAILEIKTFPDPVLRRPAAEVVSVDDEIRRLMDDMAETMYEAPGIGLAAPQVGVSKRVIVIDITYQEDPAGLICLVDPEITIFEGEGEMEEGCLSVPDLSTAVNRHLKVTVEGLDQDGRKRVIEADGLLARVLQHEIDHINGVLILDHLRGVKKDMVKKKLLKKAKKDDL
jgi:peptide deformylase